jgi:hypothetical protein
MPQAVSMLENELKVNLFLVKYCRMLVGTSLANSRSVASENPSMSF